jgi:hypothetical protein
MTILIAPSDAANKIAAALRLPKNTLAFTLRVRVGEAATLEVESYAESSGAAELATVLKRYRLEELVGPNAEVTGLGRNRSNDEQ